MQAQRTNMVTQHILLVSDFDDNKVKEGKVNDGGKTERGEERRNDGLGADLL